MKVPNDACPYCGHNADHDFSERLCIMPRCDCKSGWMRGDKGISEARARAIVRRQQRQEDARMMFMSMFFAPLVHELVRKLDEGEKTK